MINIQDTESLSHTFREEFNRPQESMLDLIGKFAPAVNAALNQLDGVLRIGFKGHKDAMKSRAARKLLQKMNPATQTPILSGDWSTVFQMIDGREILHYDAEALEGICANTNMIALFPPEKIDLHRQAKMDAKGHIVEWPERDSNKSFGVVWSLNAGLSEQGNLKASLYCTDEIAALPEFQQFLKDTEPFRIG